MSKSSTAGHRAVMPTSFDYMSKAQPDVPQNTSTVVDFWGKANPTNQGGPTSHSIIYHSLDVAATGSELIARDRHRLQRIAAAISIETGILRSAIPFLLSLHDIGKYARVFQAKSPDHWPITSLGPYREIAPGNSHVVTGFQSLVALSDEGSCRDIFDAVMPGWSASPTFPTRQKK